MAKDTGIQLIDSQDEGILLDLKINPVRDASGKIVSGLVIGNTLQQNKGLILIAQQGEFKFRPDLGVGIADMLLSENYLEYRHRIRDHFAKDGLKVTQLDLFKDKPLIIDAEYSK